ncbi:MAG TPA: hypothetical protein VFG04_09665 [Planctomycetaceae bacterium]|jgi:hypothetical protein|nr:hypothetical protein [Planctomycetaceae bacterium]
MSGSPACLSILVVGDLFSPAMQGVERRVEEFARANSSVHIFPNVTEALAGTPADAWHPDLVIVCQHWPDEYTAGEVRQLLAAFPLARVICCYGLWCGSDGRTRDVWPLSVRVPAEFSARRIDLELEVLTDARWPLPLTASRDEIFLFDPDCRIPAAPPN